MESTAKLRRFQFVKLQEVTIRQWHTVTGDSNIGLHVRIVVSVVLFHLYHSLESYSLREGKLNRLHVVHRNIT